MRFFKKAKKNEGWLTLAFPGDGIAAVRLTRGSARPAVALAAFFAGAATPEALEKTGRELRADRYRCGTVLKGGEYHVLAVDAPNVPPEELTTAVRWRVKDLLDFPVDNATVDVLTIPADTHAANRASQGLFAVVARNDVVKQCQQLFTAAKMGLSVIDIPEMAQRNISAMIEPDGRGLAMLSFGADGGLLTVTFGGELYLSRRIDVTLAQLMEGEAERQRASFDRVTLELQRSLDHFERQFHFISVAKLVLAPSTAPGFQEHLKANLYTPVDALDLADVFDLAMAPELADKVQQQRFFIALGAALRHQEALP